MATTTVPGRRARAGRPKTEGEAKNEAQRRPRRGKLETQTMRHRRKLSRLHRWAALIFGTWAVLQGLSGAVMIAGDSIHEWRHPGLYRHGSGDQGVGAAIAAARVALPEATFPGAVTLPTASRGVYRVAMVLDPATMEQRWVYVDPATGTANGVRDPEGGWIARISRFHNSLGQGSTGKIFGVKARHVVGYMALGTLVVLGLGLWLWAWPKVQRWRSLRRVRLRRGAYTAGVDIHRLVGVLATPFVGLIILSGLTLSFPDQTRPLWYWLTPGADTGPRADGFGSTVPPPRSTPPAADAKPIPLDDAVRIAVAAVPGSEAVSVRGAGAKPEGVIQVRLSHGWDPARGPEASGGNVTVYLDQFSGAVLRSVRPEDKPLFGQVYEYWTFAIHRGTFVGTATRIVWIGVCLAPLTMALTGVLTLVVRSGKRRRRVRYVRRALPALTRTEVADIARHGATRRAGPGDVLAREGAPSDSFFIVISGRVDVVQGTGSDERVIATLGPGAHFGEIGLLHDRPRTATVTAVTDAELLVLGAAGFAKLLEGSVATRAGLGDVAAERLRADAADQTR